MADVDLLREAAALMREQANLMAGEPWEVSYIDPAVTGGGIDQWFIMSDPHGVNVGPLSIHEWEPTALYMASWHPDVALAVADWIDACLARDPRAQGTEAESALIVARTYLGRES